MSEIILSVKDLTVRLKSDNSIILKNINFDLSAGDVLALDGLNGSGKSTLIKVIFGDTLGYDIESGIIICHPFSTKNVLDFTDRELLAYHATVGYVKQKDYYDGLNKVTVEDLIDDAISESKLEKKEALSLFNHYFPGNKRINIKSIPAFFSGGEQRMISIFLGLLCRKNTKLMIIDEPLNNLDFENVMLVSNLINEIHRSNKNSAMLMVTHCKVITCINRQRKLTKGRMETDDSKYECHHCMGEPDCNLFYPVNGSDV